MNQHLDNQEKNIVTTNKTNSNYKNKRKNNNDNKGNNEHDKIFRTILTNKDEASSLINKALNLKNGYKLTPEDIELYDTQYITKKFQNRLADVVYIIKNKELIKQGKVFIHIEHQTKQDKTMPYRIEEYVHEIKRVAMKDSLDGIIPKVYNILVYSGNKKWKVKNTVSTIESSLKVKVSEENQYEVIEVSSYSEEEIKSEQKVLPRVLMLESRKKTNEIVEEISKIDLSKISEERREMLLIYFNEVVLKHISPQNMKIIEKIMEGEDWNMLALEKVFVRELKKQYTAGENAGYIAGENAGYIAGENAGFIAGENAGYTAGEIAGRKTGYNDGKKKKQKEIAKNLLDMKMKKENIVIATGLEIEEIEKLENIKKAKNKA